MHLEKYTYRRITMHVTVDIDTILNNIFTEELSALNASIKQRRSSNFEDEELIIALFVSFIEHASKIVKKERIYDFLSHKYDIDPEVFDFLVGMEKRIKEFEAKIACDMQNGKGV
jgi:hypothetical protein